MFAQKTLAATLSGKYTIELENSGGGYDKLGTITEYITDKTLEEFYDYSSPYSHPNGDPNEFYQYNGPDLGFMPSQLHLFMVHSTTSGELGLFSVNGDPDGNTGEFSYMQMDYQMIGEPSDKFEIAVADENLEGRSPEVSVNESDPTLINSFYGWTNQNTDGAALSIYDADGDSDWYLEITLTNLYNNLGEPNETLYLLSSDGNSLSKTNLQNGMTFRITPNPQTVPEPSNLSGLLILGCLGGGIILLTRKC